MEAKSENRNLSLYSETSTEQVGVVDPRICQTVVKKGKQTRRYKPIIIDLDAEIQTLMEEEERQKSLENVSSETSSSVHNIPNTPDLGVRPLTTPAKPPITSYQAFATPNQLALAAPKPTPINAKPRIQCSIDVSSYLQTPISNFPRMKPKHIRPPSSIVDTPINHDRQISAIKNNNQGNEADHQREKENSPPCNGLKVVQLAFKVITVNNVTYIILSQLGRGGSSIVYHCYEQKTKLEYAIKCVDLNQDKNAVTGFINEVNLLHKLQECDRIIKMHSYELRQQEKKLYVVLEKGGKDLSRILKELSNPSKHLPIFMLIYYWMEMLYAVLEIHEHGVIHSDLKPANFLEASGKIKLIDFGISSCVQNDKTSVVKNVTLGTFSYISPEALQSEQSTTCDSPNFGKPKFKISYKSDVWSLGCILYQLVYRKTPFQHIVHTWAKLSAIMDPNHKIEYQPVDWVPEKIIDTIKDCLQYDMKARPSIKDLIMQYERFYY